MRSGSGSRMCPATPSAVERLVEPAPGAQREERVALEIRRRLGGRVERRGDGLRIGLRLQRRQRRRAERRQREPGDDLDDAIEFEGAKGEHDQ